MTHYPSRLENVLMRIDLIPKWLKLLIVFVTIPCVYVLVFLTGGIKYSYSHTMYLAIVFAGLSMGAGWGGIVGIIAGIVLGPIMPLSTPFDPSFSGYEYQNIIQWVYRAFIFFLAGSITGLFCDILKRKIVTVTDMLSHNYETKIPNIYSLADHTNHDFVNNKTIVISLLINNFDAIIEMLGHDVYYRLLNKLYLSLVVNMGKNCTIIQASNDKFWITKAYTNYKDDINHIRSVLKQPLSIANIPIFADYAIGIDLIEKQSDCQAIDSYRHADIAAKDAQKRNAPYLIYDDSLSEKKLGIELLSTFLRALEENQTFLVYQPIIDLKTMKTVALEALIRWVHPLHGMIMPDRFIPLIEGTNLINHLTDWVLKTAIDKVLELQKHGYDIPISINISPKNLSDPDFFTRIRSIINASKIEHRMIELEVTESAIIANLEDNQHWMKTMMDDGFTMSLDDFGKGYTSLAYLSQFDVKIIKLDQYFMRHILSDPGVKIIVRSAIDLSHQLGCKVVAEGIEDEIITTICQELGCDFGQGYHFAWPMKAADLDNWLNLNVDQKK